MPSKAVGIPLDVERRRLFLTLGRDKQYPSHWQVLLEERDNVTPLALLHDGGELERIAETIRSALHNSCSSSWVDGEFEETRDLIVALMKEVHNFRNVILRFKLSGQDLRNAYLDCTKILKVEIKAAIFQFVLIHHPAEAELIRELFRQAEYGETPDWAEDFPSAQ